MTSERAVQIFHTGDLGRASDWLKQISNAGMANQKHYLDLGSDASSVYNRDFKIQRRDGDKNVA